MALHPTNFTGQDRLQPGARGEIFQADMPGYRNSGDRINRTNTKLNTNAHDVPNIKYEFDRRLPVLFTYGFAYGYNQIVVPKGRIVAADPYMNLVDFDTKHAHNALTLANGGAPVRLRKATDAYRDDSDDATALVSLAHQGEEALNTAKEWSPIVGLTAAYTKSSYRPFNGKDGSDAYEFHGNLKQLTDAGLTIDTDTGKIKIADAVKATAAGITAGDVVRPGNIPVGVIQRNEYTRNDDAYNGITPGAVLTDAMIELPWFAYKDKAEGNPWGSAYGGLFPGALVKSDENGRFVLSPLSFPETDMANMGVAEYEAERQQVIGQVYSVDASLIPEGAAKWATWSLSDRMNFVEFNPAVDYQNGRAGEDAVSNSPYKSTGTYPGYPYDASYSENDLHMLASTARSAGNRMDQQYQYENLGIPGLTDGYNAASRFFGPEKAGKIYAAGGADYTQMLFRLAEVNVEDLAIQIGGGSRITCVLDATPTAWLKVSYCNLLQGVIILEVTNKAAADAALAGGPLDVTFFYTKRGLAGVPTFMDWDGCVGSVKVLLTK